MSFPPISRVFAGLLLSTLLVALSSSLKKSSSHEVPPDRALATFQLAEGFQIEMIASEPLVSDPVAMEIDEFGRMYVVEMHGYPLDKSGSGMIKLLSDRDGDGRMDDSKVFAEGLMLPTGILRWKQGVLVTDAPNLLYLEDSDGDGRADVRDTLLTGFALSNPQHNLNSPILGLDNWIYLAHEPAVSTQTFKSEFGDRGGEVHFPSRPDSPRLPDNARGKSVRLQPDNSRLEMLAANTQFGHSFDAWGRYLLVSNANHLIHQVIGATYLNRNPSLLVSNATQSVSDHGAAAEVFPITQNPQNQLLTDVGVFTSACGITAYQGGLFPKAFDGTVFVAEPVSNLIHADVLRDRGATFTGSRVYPDKEFLASTDAWFRPVNMYTGPDGALYVVDYYRQIIEHPEWMAEDVIKSGALYHGVDKGRIYRITPKGTKPYVLKEELKSPELSNANLVKRLGDSNIWWRRNAQRLLIDRRALGEASALEHMAVSAEDPIGRLHALWTLEGLGVLQPSVIIRALKDPVSGVRENGVKLSEAFSTDPGVRSALYALRGDSNAKVRFQLLCTLGSIGTPESARVREELLFQDMEDAWVQIAALSAAPSARGDLLNAVLNRFDASKPAYPSLVERLSTLTGAGGTPEEVRSVVGRALKPESGTHSGWQSAMLRGLAQGLKNNTAASAALRADQSFLVEAALNHESTTVRQGSIRLLGLTGLPASPASQEAISKSARRALEKASPSESRTAAIQFLALDDPGRHAELLKGLISPTEPTAVQLAALQTLAGTPGVGISEFVVSHWTTLTPEVRNAAINTFMGNEARVTLLLDAVEKKVIDPASIGWPRSVGLMAQGNAVLKSRSRALLTQKDDGRQEIIQKYTPALAIAGSVNRGRSVFTRSCSACHQVGGKGGTPYGPDLGTIRNRSPESILQDIINPNRSIADGYDMWSLEMASGETVQGLIVTETPSALTIRSYGDPETVIARQNIRSLKSLGMSVMPAGLESQITPEDMSHLLAFLKQGR